MTQAALNQLSYNYCALPLAAYACRPDRSAGRIYPEPDSRYRTPFQRDRDRIIHAGAFRRLKYKTQVFVYHEGDHFRTRLSHTLEVAQIARTIARALLVNEDLAETVALAHDIGHTPFAHVGEDVLVECMKDVGGFDHNDQSLRVITTLEKKYPKWPGLNMTWETLEGIVKHNGPVVQAGHDKPLPVTLAALQKQTDLRLDTYASVEAQAAALSDDIAYNNHDLEDGLRAGLFTIGDLEGVALTARVMAQVRAAYPGLEEKYFVYETVREMIGMMVEDVLAESRARLDVLKADDPDAVRAADRAMVAFSPPMYEMVEELRAFLWNRMYRHYRVMRMRVKVSRIVRDLYEGYIDEYLLMPEDCQREVEAAGGPADKVAHARVVADYIAGMTDRYAIKEHERIFDLHADLR